MDDGFRRGISAVGFDRVGRWGGVLCLTTACMLSGGFAQTHEGGISLASSRSLGNSAVPILTLEQALALALKGDATYLFAEADYRVSLERLPQARAALRPNVNLTGALTTSVSRPATQTWLDEPLALQSSAHTVSSGATSTSQTVSSRTSGGMSGRLPVTSTSDTTESSTFQRAQDETSSQNGQVSEWEQVHKRVRGTSAEVGVSLTWPIYRPALSRAVEQSAYLGEQGHLGLAAARQSVILRVAKAYFDIVAAKSVLDALVAQEAALRQQVDVAEQSFSEGVVTIADVREAQANLDLVLAQKVVQQNNWSIKRASLQAMVGLPVAAVQSLKDADGAMVGELGAMDQWTGRAADQSYGVRIQQLGLLATRKELEKQEAVGKPTLDFVANAGTSRIRERSTGQSEASETFAGSTGSQSETQTTSGSQTESQSTTDGQSQTVSTTQDLRGTTTSSSEGHSDSRTSSSRPASLGRSSSRQWDAYVGIRLNVPLLDGGFAQSKIREALALQDKQEAELLRARSDAVLDAQTAYMEVKGYQAEVLALKAAQVSGLVALEANQLGYEVGLKTNTDVLNAQQQLFAVRRDIVKARVNALVSWLRLKASVGELAEDDIVLAGKHLSN